MWAAARVRWFSLSGPSHSLLLRMLCPQPLLEAQRSISDTPCPTHASTDMQTTKISQSPRSQALVTEQGGWGSGGRRDGVTKPNWVHSPVPSKANLVTPGCGEGKRSIFARHSTWGQARRMGISCSKEKKPSPKAPGEGFQRQH